MVVLGVHLNCGKGGAVGAVVHCPGGAEGVVNQYRNGLGGVVIQSNGDDVVNVQGGALVVNSKCAGYVDVSGF